MHSGKVNVLVYQAPGAYQPPPTGAGPCVAPSPPVGHPTKDGAAHGYAYSQNSAAGPCVAPPPPVGHPTKDGAAHGYAYSQNSAAGPCVAPPPPVGHPTKDGAAHGYAYSQNSAAPVQTKSGGACGCFWQACASVLCCCCAVDGWFHTY